MTTVSTDSNNPSPHKAVKSTINIIIGQQAVQRQQHMKDTAFSALEQQQITLKGNSIKPTSSKTTAHTGTNKDSLDPQPMLTDFMGLHDQDPMISRTLSPWHGTSSGCKWRNGLQYRG